MAKQMVMERMARIETDIKYIKEKLDDFIKCAPKKYASKLTEQIVYGLCGMIIIAFVTKLLNIW